MFKANRVMIIASIKNKWCFCSLRIHLTNLVYCTVLVLTSLVCWAQNPGWLPPVSSEFTYSANVISIIKLDSVISNHADDRIAFFAGNELRGLSKPVLTGPGQYMHFVSIYSNTYQEDLKIKVYHKGTDKVYEVLTPFQFKVQNIYGSIGSPYEVNIYTDDNAPLRLLNVAVQQTIQGLPFPDIDLSGYLVQPDPYPVVWSFVPNPNLIVSIAGSLLKVQGITGFSGQTQLVVNATEMNNLPSSSQVAETVLTFHVAPLYAAPAWNTIPDQKIFPGGQFDSVYLHDYEFQYGGPAICYSYLPVIEERVPPETRPNWTAIECTGSNMSVTARLDFTPKYTFNHADDILAAFVNNKIKGVATKDITTGLYYLTIADSIIAGDSIIFKFYSGAMKKIFSKESTFLYEPYGIKGNSNSPIVIDLAPLIPVMPMEPIPGGFAVMHVSIIDSSYSGTMCFDFIAKDCQYPDYLNDVTRAKFRILSQPTATISYTGNPFCSTSGTGAVTLDGTTGGAFSVVPAGLSIDGTTGLITPRLSLPGDYTVSYDIPASDGFIAVSAKMSIKITPLPAAMISYAGTPFCTSAADVTVSVTGTAGGTYSATPTGLNIDGSTGIIKPSISTPGDYTVSYDIGASGGCAAVSAKTSIKITSLPAATINYAGTSFCNSSADVTVSVTGTAGGTYSATPTGLSIDGMTGLIKPSISTPGDYTVSYDIGASGGCEPVSAKTSIKITPLPAAMISYAGTPFCTSAADVTVSVTGTAGGTYSATPTGLNIDGSTGIIKPSISTSGDYTVSYDIGASGGCAAVSAKTLVTIAEMFTATISYSGTPFCTNVGTGAVTLSGTLGGTFSASSSDLKIDASTGLITPSLSMPGDYTVSYDIGPSGQCAAVSAKTSIKITKLPDATISYAGTPFCTNAGTGVVTLSGTLGGTFSASSLDLKIDVSSGLITPSLSMPGDYTVSYDIGASGGCAALSAKTSLKITPLPAATLSYVGTPFCTSAPDVTVSVTGTAGGIFSATPSGLNIDETTGLVKPSISTPGDYTVSYDIGASGGCAAISAKTSLKITTLPAATISYSGTPFCTSAADVTVSFTGTAGGTYTATPMGLSIDGTTGLVKPSISTPGDYTVSFDKGASGGCAAVSAKTSIKITALPAATISYAGTPFCSSAADVTVSFTGTAGGTYSAAPMGLSIDGSTGMIKPSISTPGDYTVSYDIGASAGCAGVSAKTSLKITPLPTAMISYIGTPFCTSAADVTVSFTGTAGGTYTATPMGLSIDGTTGLVKPSISTPGDYTVSYDIGASGGCAAVSAKTSVKITPLPTATLSYIGTPFCISAADVTVSVTGTAGGTYSATPIGLSIDGMTGLIKPSISTPGDYTVSYDIGASGGCSAVSAKTLVTIAEMFTATISYSGTPFCTNGGTGAVTLSGTLGGTFSASSSDLKIDASTGLITPSLSMPGDYTVSYDIAASGQCAAVSAKTSIKITKLPEATISYAGTPFCANAGTGTVTQTGTTNGMYSSTSGLSINLTNGTITPMMSSPGDYTVSYDIAASGGCAAVMATTLVTITILPMITNPGDQTVCNSYILPKITGTNLSPNAKYYNNSQANMGTVITGPITSTQQVWIYDQTGSMCSDEESFMVTVTSCSITNDPSIADPCACKNNATNLANDGQFDEVIEVNSGITGQTWKVTAVSGLYNSISPSPPASPILFTADTLMTDIGGGIYRISGIHVDGIGYFISVSNGINTLSIDNRCSYPNPTITSPAGPFCAGDAPFPLKGTPGDAKIVKDSFTINGIKVTTFDPSVGPGTYTVVYTVDGGMPKDQDSSDPGCIQSVTQEVVVFTPVPLVCRGNINVSIGGNCNGDGIAEALFGSKYDSRFYNLALKTTQGTQIDLNNLNPYLGKTLNYEVLSRCDGNKCWGTIKIEDKIGPVFNSCHDITIQCYEVAGFMAETTTFTNKPSTSDNCEESTLTKTDISHVTNCGGTITRTWVATDASGNSSTCVQTVTVSRDFSFVGPWTPPTDGATVPWMGTFIKGGVYCPGDIVISCDKWRGTVSSSINIGESFKYTFPATGPSLSGIYIPTSDDIFTARTLYSAPFIATGDMVSDNNFVSLHTVCNLFITSSDLVIKACANCSDNTSFKIIRKWTVLDWCSGNIYTCFPQMIKVLDDDAPAMEVLTPITATTSPWTCAANVTIPVPVMTDNCDEFPRFTIRNASTGELVPSSRIAAGLVCGVHTFNYTVTDCCGNVSGIYTLTVTVKDNTPPVPVVKRDIVVSLTSNGYDGNGTAKLFASSLDNGSNDNCGAVWYEIRRSKSAPVCESIGFGGFANNSTFRDGDVACGRGATRRYRVGVDQQCHDVFATYDCEGRKISTGPGVSSITVNATTGAWSISSTTKGVWNGANLVDKSKDLFFACPQSGAYDQLVPGVDGSGDYSLCDTDGGQFVKFCCVDLERIEVDANGDGKIDTLDKGFIEVQFRVWDDANKNGIYGECGIDNWNDSWAFVKVECKLPPVITPPADATVYCDWPIEKNLSTTWIAAKGFNFSKTGGYGWAYGVCGNLSDLIEFRDTQVDEKCAAGVVTRTFRVTNWGFTRTATQKITILSREGDWKFFNDWPAKPCAAYYHEVTPSSYKYINTSNGNVFVENPQYINLAKEIGVTDCDGPDDAEIKACQPLYEAGPCDVIGVNIKKWDFTFEDGECKKWVVDYHFINWCDHKEIIYRKFFYYNDNTPPVIVKEDICIPAGTGVTSTAFCQTVFTHTKSAFDIGCSTDNTWLKWNVYIDINNDNVDDYLMSSFVPPHYNYGSTHIENGLRTKYIKPTRADEKVTISIPINLTLPWNYHKVTWKVTDGCHNYASVTDYVEIRDKKAPTPYCVPLSTALMAGLPSQRMVELWANDFDKGAFDNCHYHEELSFTFDGWIKSLSTVYTSGSRKDQAHKAYPHYFNAAGWLADVITTTLDANNATRKLYLSGMLQQWIPNGFGGGTSGYVYTTTGTKSVRIDVTDLHGNSDWCMTELKVVCRGDGCPAGSRIAGNVHTELGQGVMNVSIIASAALPEYPKQEMTDERGNYGMDIYTDTELKASKDGDDVNGVSTLDLVIIQRHILGIQPITSSYQLIAADANNDGKVTVMDMTEIRRVIMGITNGYPNNTSWRFPIENQVISADKPFPYIEKMMARLENTTSNFNFIAVKIGDVNGNATVNLANPISEGRSEMKMVMAIEEQTLAADEMVEIPVSTDNYRDVAGFQYTMNIKGGTFVGIQSGALEMNEANIGKIAKDKVTMSYAGKEGVTLNKGTTLFTVLVKADRPIKVSEMLSIGSAVTPAESYTSNFEVGKVSLEVRRAPVKVIQLHQNEPNPFKGQTSLTFSMPEAAAVTIKVHDVTGKVVSERNINANKGLNSEIFTRENVGASGVMYYTLKSGEFTTTKKMIVIE